MILSQSGHRNFELLWFFCLIVIVWGAWVRISHSGDGCGASWPLCQGEIIPGQATQKTWIELFHRALSGIFGLWVLVYFIKYPKVYFWILLFTITEALLGAKLVLSGLVGLDDSFKRTLVMSLHQVNSFLLSGSIAIHAFKPGNRFQTGMRKGHLALLFLIVTITGAWAALSTTLYPAESLLAGLNQDFSGNAHHAVQLRILHPILGLSMGIGLILFFQKRNLNSRAVLAATMIIIGATTLLLLSPTPLKLFHLALGHTLWALFLPVLYQDPTSEDSASR